MKKKHSVVALPTENASIDHILFRVSESFWVDSNKKNRPEAIPHYLYFVAPSIEEDEVNGEKIKEEDWFINIRTNSLHKCTISDINIQSGINSGEYHGKFECRKVIATTNPKLWRKPFNPTLGILPANWRESIGIPKIPVDFIQAFVREQGIWEVLLDYWSDTTQGGHPTDVTLSYVNTPKLNSQGAVIIHPVKEKMYTRKQMIGACFRAFEHRIGNLPYDTTSFGEWKIEWFDKKYPE